MKGEPNSQNTPRKIRPSLPKTIVRIFLQSFQLALLNETPHHEKISTFDRPPLSHVFSDKKLLRCKKKSRFEVRNPKNTYYLIVYLIDKK